MCRDGPSSSRPYLGAGERAAGGGGVARATASPRARIRRTANKPLGAGSYQRVGNCLRMTTPFLGLNLRRASHSSAKSHEDRVTWETASHAFDGIRQRMQRHNELGAQDMHIFKQLVDLVGLRSNPMPLPDTREGDLYSKLVTFAKGLRGAEQHGVMCILHNGGGPTCQRFTSQDWGALARREAAAAAAKTPSETTHIPHPHQNPERLPRRQGSSDFATYQSLARVYEAPSKHPHQHVASPDRAAKESESSLLEPARGPRRWRRGFS